MKNTNMPTWESLQKRMIWDQLKFIKNKKILDYGSGEGYTANHFSQMNKVTAIEPSEVAISNRVCENEYRQIKGGLEALKKIESKSYDVIFCHFVLEYTEDRSDILAEFERILKKDGLLSIIKHNRIGRVMQMVTLLNDFEHADELLDGKPSVARKYGTINYYTDQELLEWSRKFKVSKIYGIRTFWALQQEQEIHTDPDWQDKMLKMEMRVCEIEEYRAVASFHHLILHRKPL